MSWHRRTGRSDVVAKNGMVATSQSLATQAGITILQSGGNAIDAAVASAAVLDIVEPFSTGCGGDAFALIHLPGQKKPLSINGSGRTGSLATLDDLLEKQWTEIPVRGGAPVTVPGALHMWAYVVEKYGALELMDVLTPAIHYARHGFPVSDIISQVWPLASSILINDYAKDLYSIKGRPPIMGETMKNPDLADVLESVGNEGPEAFYTGETAEAIVSLVQEHGGFLTLEDLESHATQETTPISTSYRGTNVFEHPPNGQGFAALIMLNIMEQYEISSLSSISAERYHLMIEAKKLAYGDLHQHNSDPGFYNVPLEELLSKQYAKNRAKLINPSKAMTEYESGVPISSDTIYLATADSEGRAVSFINSLFHGFGSGLVVPEKPEFLDQPPQTLCCHSTLNIRIDMHQGNYHSIQSFLEHYTGIMSLSAFLGSWVETTKHKHTRNLSVTLSIMKWVHRKLLTIHDSIIITIRTLLNLKEDFLRGSDKD